MKTKRNQKGCCALEIAISPDDLKVRHKCKIIEKQSTAGFEEVPQIEFPSTYSPTNQMIQYDQHWAVVAKWKVYGPLACLLKDGVWKNQILIEKMGSGESSFNAEAKTIDVGQPGHAYKAVINVKPRDLGPGVYRVICCLQYCLKNGYAGPIAGFCDLGLIKIYQDKTSHKHNYPETATTE